MHADYRDQGRCNALYELLDQTWPGIRAKIETAQSFGWNWPDTSTPFAHFKNGAAIAHVGVLDIPCWLNGEATRIAGIHAVCTDKGWRRRGHFRESMTGALNYVDQHWRLSKLCTDKPELYEPFGFRVVPQNRFCLPCAGKGAGRARPLTVEDLPWFRTMMSCRTPVSNKFCALDDGWLLGTDEVLWSGGLTHLYRIENSVVAWEIEQNTLHLYDVAAGHLPLLSTLLAACPWPFERVRLWFSPDLLAPNATPIEWPEDDFLMVRGDWPVTGPFAMSPLAAH